MLKVSNLQKRFGGLVALRGVDLHVPRAAILGIIGMNGSGKTTMLNCINGLYVPDAGSIALDGAEIAGKQVHEVARLGVGRTFQVPRVFQHLSLLDNLDVAQQQTSRNADERYAQSEYWLHKVELHRLRHNHAEELSGGQQKLLELARIMVAQLRSSCSTSRLPASTRPWRNCSSASSATSRPSMAAPWCWSRTT